MKVSIITVCFNSSNTIEKTMLSVFEQTHGNIEYIFIDGKSTDDTISIIKKYENNITKLVSEPDLGIYDAMNKGITLATGEIVGILNSDDLYADKHVLADVMKYFSDDPDLDILYGNLNYVKNLNTKAIVRKWVSKPYYNGFFEHGNVPPHPALFLRSNVYKKVGLFNLEYKLAADYEFMFRVFKKHNFKSKYVNRLTVKMRLGGATNKSFENILNGNKEILKAWKNNGLKPPITLMFLRFVKRLVQFI